MARRHPSQQDADGQIAALPLDLEDPMHVWFAPGVEVQPWWLDHLAEHERATRRLRLRLQASLDANPRTCGNCGDPLAGRTDRRFCSDRCRVAAHRRKAHHADPA